MKKILLLSLITVFIACQSCKAGNGEPLSSSASKMVTLISSDKKAFVVTERIISSSGTLSGMIRGSTLESSENRVQLREIDSAILEILIVAMSYIADHPNQVLRKEILQTFKIEPTNINNIILAADFLDIQLLVTALAKQYLIYIENKQLPIEKAQELTRIIREKITLASYNPLSPQKFVDLNVGFSIRELMQKGLIPQIVNNQLNLNGLLINSLDGLLEIPGINDLEDSLRLHDNRITTIEPGAFQNLNKLNTLNLSKNHIATIEQGIFHGLNNLENLYLDDNKIAAIKPGIFQGLNSLEILNLGFNNITVIEADAFQGLNKLEGLVLYNNKIEAIKPGTFHGLNNLISLFFDNNKIVAIEPGVFQDLNKLDRLNLDKNQISFIRAGAFYGLNNLMELYLDDNKIAAIELGAFRGLDKLDRLKLNTNRITFIKLGVFLGLNNLKELYLDDNKIAAIEPRIFWGLDRLRKLTLDTPVKIIHTKFGSERFVFGKK